MGAPNGLRGYRVEGLSHIDIERRARGLREVVGIGPAQRVDVIGLFESMGKWSMTTNGQRLRFDPAVNPLPVGIEAMAMHDPAASKIVLVLSPDTYDGAEKGNPHHRFSVCHEIGHGVLHVRELVRLSRIPHHRAALQRGMATHKIYEDTEWQADAFAGAMLAPARELAAIERRAPLTVECIMATFGMSRPAATIRLENFTKRRSDLLR